MSRGCVPGRAPGGHRSNGVGGSGGVAVALPLPGLACSLHNDMATFDEAGVSEKPRGNEPALARAGIVIAFPWRDLGLDAVRSLPLQLVPSVAAGDPRVGRGAGV